MAVGGLPIPIANHAEAVAAAALEILEEFHKLTARHLQLRIGVHTGPVVAGVIGKNKFIYDLWGDTVNIASRMQSQGQADSIQVSAATYRHLKDQFELKPRGKIQIKGKEMMQVFLLEGHKSFDPVVAI
jgi:adenylate cyclase